MFGGARAVGEPPESQPSVRSLTAVCRPRRCTNTGLGVTERPPSPITQRRSVAFRFTETKLVRATSPVSVSRRALAQP